MKSAGMAQRQSASPYLETVVRIHLPAFVTVLPARVTGAPAAGGDG